LSLSILFYLPRVAGMLELITRLFYLLFNFILFYTLNRLSYVGFQFCHSLLYYINSILFYSILFIILHQFHKPPVLCRFAGMLQAYYTI